MKGWPADFDLGNVTDRRFLSNHPIFLGSGKRSLFLLELLRARLEHGVECLGTIQLSRDEEELAEIPQLQVSIENVVRDIAAALTGKTITFGDE